MLPSVPRADQRDEGLQMPVTWLYIVINGASMRVRYDLRLRCEVGRPEAWTEPPSKVNDYPYTHRVRQCEPIKSPTQERR
jgi:hypothetical protein